MSKRKGRAARKQQRENAERAKDHGLPAPALAPKPQKTRRVGGDTVAAAVASEKAGRSGPVRRLPPPPASGVPVLAKVVIGAAVVLAVVYGLSQFRKSGDISGPAQPNSASVELEQAADGKLNVVPDETGVPEAEGVLGEADETIRTGEEAPAELSDEEDDTAPPTADEGAPLSAAARVSAVPAPAVAPAPAPARVAAPVPSTVQRPPVATSRAASASAPAPATSAPAPSAGAPAPAPSAPAPSAPAPSAVAPAP